MRQSGSSHRTGARRRPIWQVGAWVVVLLLPWTAVSAQQQWGCGVKVKPAHQKDMRQAMSLIEAHRYRDASQLLRRVAQKNPKAAEPRFWLGMCAVVDGFNTAGIRRYFSSCIELCPEYPDARAHYYMGVILYTDERYDEAIASFERYFAIANNSDRTDYTVLYEEASNYLYWSQFLAEANLSTVPFDPQRIGGVSSRYDEALPYLAPDGQTFYYLRKQPEKKPPTIYARELDEPRWRLFYSTLADTVFTSGKEMPSPFNSGVPEGSVSLTADGSELYYSRIVQNGTYANSDIYVVRRRADGRWGDPTALPQQVNGPRTWESQPTVSPDGQLLLFASNRPGGQGGIDLWRCHRLPNGDWSRAENLGPAVNSIGNDKAPFLAADGHTLYFLSDGWQGFGGYDIYFTDLSDRYGNRPTNLGLPINTEADEVSFGVVADGSRAYFAGRTATSRSADVLMFDLYPKAQPDPMRPMRIEGAKVSDSATLTLHREGQKEVRYRFRHGSVVAMVPSKGECLLTVADGQRVAIDYATPTSASALVARLAADTAYTSLRFEMGSRLSDRTRRLLDAWAAWLLAHPRVRVSVECPRQTDARAAADYLVSHGKLRAERVAYRGGTDIVQPRIILQ